jgi:hypothetical protein
MKNAFKLGFLTFAIALTVTACASSEKAAETEETSTDTTVIVDDSAAIDTAVTDTIPVQ